MANLIHLRTGRRVALSAHTLVGRGAECGIRLDDGVVSQTHAAVRWAGQQWFVRDLGSSNGTYLNHRALSPGEEADLDRGAVLGFGSDNDPWIVEGLAAPTPVAVRLGDGARSVAVGSLILLPNADEPEMALVGGPDGTWHVDDEAAAVVRDGDLLSAAGGRWRIEIPRSVEPTVRAEVDEARLRFHVSSDEEFVEMEVIDGERTVRLRHRSFHYLLLTLHRLRARDHELPAARQGWVDQEDLARMLQLNHATVNVHICRARKALGEVRNNLGTRVVERRKGVSQIRFGLDSAEIVRS